MLIAFASIFIQSVVCVRSRLDQAFGYTSHRSEPSTKCVRKRTLTYIVRSAHITHARTRACIHTGVGPLARTGIGYPPLRVPLGIPQWQRSHAVSFPGSVTRGDPTSFSLPTRPEHPLLSSQRRTCTPIDSTRPEYWCLSFPVGPQRGVAFVLVGGLFFG